MKKIRVLGVCIVFSLLFSMGCSEVLPEKIQVEVNKKADEVKLKALEELQKALTSQIKDFMKSTDLQKTLGLTDDENEEVENSLKDYLESYDKDSEAFKETLDALTEKVNELKESGALEGLSVDEINKKLQEILDKDN